MLDLPQVPSGKYLRMRRLFHPASGRALVVALDHGILSRPDGLEDLGRTLTELLPGRPDGVLLNTRMFARYAHLWKGRHDPAVVLGVDAFIQTSIPGDDTPGEDHVLEAPVWEALAAGADAVKVILAFGRRDMRVFARNMEMVSQVLAEAGRVGVPVMVEATLWGELVEPRRQNDLGLIADIARIATELGADMLKLPFNSDVKGYRRIVETTPVPVLILGGTRTGSDEELYDMVRAAVDAGVAGLVFGRNIWQHPNPRQVLERLAGLVHGQ